jgi:hypothetical protein
VEKKYGNNSQAVVRGKQCLSRIEKWAINQAMWVAFSIFTLGLTHERQREMARFR